MVRWIHLKKRRISQRGAGTKYYIDCSKYSENADDIQSNTLIRNTNHVAILKAVFVDNAPKKNKHIVVKIVRSNKGAEHEYNIGQTLYENKLIGFIKYTCLFSCYDTTNEDHSEITAREPATKLDSKICKAPHIDKNLKKVIIMPYIQNGSLEDYNWNSENIHVLKSVLIQAVVSLAFAYDTIGFLHGDLHLGNVLFKETKQRTITYVSSNLGNISIETAGHKVVIMDFEKSETHVDKGDNAANVSFWDNIYVMLNRVNTLSPNHGKRLSWDDSEIIRFLREAKKRKYPCIREHIVRLHDMMERSEFEFFEVREYKYCPDDV
jgi:serine/threonine protein kinase